MNEQLIKQYQEAEDKINSGFDALEFLIGICQSDSDELKQILKDTENGR